MTISIFTEDIQFEKGTNKKLSLLEGSYQLKRKMENRVNKVEMMDIHIAVGLIRKSLDSFRFGNNHI